MHDDNLQGESRAFVPFRSPSQLPHLLPTCKPFYLPRSFSSSAFFSHLLTGRQEYDQAGAKEQNTNKRNWIWWNLLSTLINTQDIFLTPSLAKTRGPSENHICSFIAPSIPRSWQFGANLGGEGQKLPPPPKIAVSGEELAVVEMMQKVAVVVEMMHFFCKSWWWRWGWGGSLPTEEKYWRLTQLQNICRQLSSGSRCNLEFPFLCFARLQSDTLAPFTRCLAFYSVEMAISIPMGAMWCSRSNPWPSRGAIFPSLPPSTENFYTFVQLQKVTVT